MAKLQIIATLIIKEEYIKELNEVFRFVVAESRKEEGNVSYELYQDIKNPLKFLFLETWKSQEAINKHNLSPHFKKFTGEIKNKIDILQVDIIKKIY